MPNHITNIVELECDGAKSREILEFLRVDGEGYGTVDFNKLVPMPESLNIESGSETHHGIEIYLTAVNPSEKDFGYPKMKMNEFIILSNKLNGERFSIPYNCRLNDSEIKKYTSSNPFDYYFKLGETAVDNFKQYGAIDWYGWRYEHWGTKWNAYDCMEVNPSDGYLEFLTAWSSVPEIVEKISAKFPDVPIRYSWADEDIGFNTGRAVYLAGKPLDSDVPEGGSYHAYEIACEVQGYDIKEFDVEPEPLVKSKDNNRDSR